MFRLKKGEFNLIFAEQQGGTVINIFRDNSKISQAFGVVNPGNLFILSNGQWILLDISKIMAPTQQFTNDLERASAAFTIKLMQTPIDNKLIVLDPHEQIFMFTVVYDIASRTPIEWIVAADAYYLSTGKVEAVKGNQVTSYTLTGIPRQLNKSAEIYPTVIVTPSPQKGVKTTPVKLDMVQIQKTKPTAQISNTKPPQIPVKTPAKTTTTSPLKLPPVSAITNIPSGLYVNKEKAEKKKYIMDLALKRAKRKALENPDQEPPVLIGDWKTKHAQYLKDVEEQKIKDLLKKSKLAQERKQNREMLKREQEKEAKKKENAQRPVPLFPQNTYDDEDTEEMLDDEDTEEMIGYTNKEYKKKKEYTGKGKEEEENTEEMSTEEFSDELD